MRDSATTGGTSGSERHPCRRRERAEAAGLALAGLATLAAVVAWEVARPTLPVPFELAAAARAPGAPSWMGRLPMAAAACVGMLALYTLLARTAERRAGTYAVAVLATAPAWFVHGRTMTGVMVPMACSVVVLAGTGLAVLDERASGRARAGALGVAVAAAVVAMVATRFGIPNRGVTAVVAVPLAAVGGAAVLWKASGRAGATMLAIAVGMAVAALVVARVAPSGALADLLLGERPARVTGSTTFEAPVAAVAYGLVPWTPLVPFALARRPNSAGHLAVMIGAVLAIAVHAALAPRSGTSAVVGVASIAGAVATMLRSLEETRRPAIALVATVAVIGWLIAHDFGLSPERVLVAFGASDTALPTTHAAASSMAIRSSIWLCMVLTAVSLLTPRSYRMFWGVGALPCEDDRRLHVTSGPSDGRDRIPAGVLEIR